MPDTKMPFDRKHPDARWMDEKGASFEWYTEGDTVDLVVKMTTAQLVNGEQVSTVSSHIHNHIADETLIAILKTKGYSVIRMSS